MLDKKLVAVYWGSFDPPTLAHEYIINYCTQHFEQLLLVVNDDSRKQYSATFEHRVAMLQLGINSEKVKILIQHTKEQQEYFKLREMVDLPLIAIVGSDSLNDWLSQQREEKIERYDQVLVMERANDAVQFEKQHPDVHYHRMPEQYKWGSSSEARKQVNKKQQLVKIISEPVAEYIYNKKLYDLSVAPVDSGGAPK